ncbi:MAG: hypothetical protein P3W89_007765, partial [Aquificaceae bacterium]|nr:hypothetical protein [Aquificaceae bacterium]
PCAFGLGGFIWIVRVHTIISSWHTITIQACYGVICAIVFDKEGCIFGMRKCPINAFIIAYNYRHYKYTPSEKLIKRMSYYYSDPCKK